MWLEPIQDLSLPHPRSFSLEVPSDAHRKRNEGETPIPDSILGCFAYFLSAETPPAGLCMLMLVSVLAGVLEQLLGVRLDVDFVLVLAAMPVQGMPVVVLPVLRGLLLVLPNGS